MESNMSNTENRAYLDCSDVGSFGVQLRDFFDRHADWAMANVRDVAVYCLPEVAIDSIAMATRERPPLLNAAQLTAEREYTKLCRQSFAIGTCDGRFITGTPLNSRAGPPKRHLLDKMKNLGWTDRDVDACARLIGATDTVAERAKGYLGWLLTEPIFHDDVAELRSA